jgi:RNA polymerase sigma factor (sigma-70 family)
MRSPSGTDDELMAALASGRSEALCELIRRHRSWVLNLLRGLTGDGDQAEDLTQEVFTRVHRYAAGYSGNGTFPAWVRRIATNLAMTFLERRKRGNLVGLSELDEEIDRDERLDPMAAAMASGVRRELRDAVRGLPEAQRMAVVMRYFGDMSLQDIALAMDCAEGTVKSRIFHGLRRLRKQMTNDLS